MKNSSELLKLSGIVPRLRLGDQQDKGGVKSTGQHIVKVLEDKLIKKPHPKTGKEIEWVRYTLEENGEKKIYDTKLKNDQGELSYLVQRFAEIKEGDEVRLEMKKKGIKNYISVDPIHTGSDIEVNDEEDVPSFDRDSQGNEL